MNKIAQNPNILIGLVDKIKADLGIKFSQEASIHVVTIQKDGRKIMEILKKGATDFALIDTELPNLSGIEIIRQIKKLSLKTKVILYASKYDRTYLQGLVDGEMWGFIHDTCGLNEFEACLKEIFAGKKYVSEKINDYLNQEKEKTADKEDLGEKLSRREWSVFELWGKGYTAKQVADNLSVSAETVKTHKKSITTKLRLKGSHRLSHYAMLVFGGIR